MVFSNVIKIAALLQVVQKFIETKLYMAENGFK